MAFYNGRASSIGSKLIRLGSHSMTVLQRDANVQGFSSVLLEITDLI